jgi:hypothetical protein
MAFQLMKQNKLLTMSIVSGFYGFARGMNSSYAPPNDVIGNKLMYASMNGIMYSVPPYSAYYLLKLINRIDVKLTSKDPTKYPDLYDDMYCKNPNVFI